MPTAANSSCDRNSHSSSHMPSQFDMIVLIPFVLAICLYVSAVLFSWILGNSSSDGFSSCPLVTLHNLVTGDGSWPACLLAMPCAIMVSSCSLWCGIDRALATSSFHSHIVLMLCYVDIRVGGEY